MCGITGFVGKGEALPFLMQGLNKLEYRGYDSAGVTLVDDNGLYTFKSKGRLCQLEDLLKGESHPQKTGIGHTRWATHGIPVILIHIHIRMRRTRFLSYIMVLSKIIRPSKKS